MKSFSHSGIEQSYETLPWVIPAAHIPQRDCFEAPFLAHVAEMLAQEGQSHSAFRDLDTKGGRNHMEKLGKLPDEHVELGVARKLNYPWFDMEPRVASKFMFYLATTLNKL